jgi:hypothetical protein
MRLLPTSRFACLRACFATVCLGSLVLIGSRHIASADLRIGAETPHAEMWRKVYEQLPSAWKSAHPVFVQEVSDAEMERLVARMEGESSSRSSDGSVVDGCFQPAEREDDLDTITLRESLKGQDAELVFTHEYGHFVWDHLMKRAQRDQYRRLWRDQKQQGHLITRYAGDSAEEGFAEAYAYFLRKSAALRRRDGASWTFLNDLLPEKQRFAKE